MINPTLPTARDSLRADLADRSTDALNALLSDVRRGPYFWGICTVEVEIICELKIRQANKELGYV